jgi:putative transposase
MHWSDRSNRRQAYNDPGHAHELTFCCRDRYEFLRADRTCLWLAEAIRSARVKHCFNLWAYVFMPDHVHLIVHPRVVGYDIRVILKAIKEPVGRKAVAHIREHHPQWLQRLTVKRGSRDETQFWQPGGGFDRNVIEPDTLLYMIYYIHMTPVRKGHVSKPSEWKWSSAGWFEGLEPNNPKPDCIPPDWCVVANKGKSRKHHS